MEEPSCVIKDVEIDDRNCRIVQLEGLVSRARRSRASRIGALDTLSTPLKGVYISSIMKKPLDTADANNARLIIAFRPAGANSPKLTKTMVDHAVSTIINGSAVELLILMAVCQRVCCRSIAILRASVLLIAGPHLWVTILQSCRKPQSHRAETMLILRTALSAKRALTRPPLCLAAFYGLLWSQDRNEPRDYPGEPLSTTSERHLVLGCRSRSFQQITAN
jgi:hypothetical protein